MSIRSCAAGKADVLDVEIVNNRVYGMTLTYGTGLAWANHEAGDTPADRARNALGDRTARSGTLYLPPLSKASTACRG